MARHRLRRRYGRAFGDLPAARRPMHRSRTYHGYTLELWGGSKSDYGQSAFEVKLYKGGWHNPVAVRHAPTAAEAFARARSWVDTFGVR